MFKGCAIMKSIMYYMDREYFLLTLRENLFSVKINQK